MNEEQNRRNTDELKIMIITLHSMNFLLRFDKYGECQGCSMARIKGRFSYEVVGLAKTFIQDSRINNIRNKPRRRVLDWEFYVL